MNTEIVDVDHLVENIKSYEDPVGEGVGRLEQKYSDVPSELTRLIYRMEQRGVDPEKCLFLLNPRVKLRLSEEAPYNQCSRHLERPVKKHSGIPYSMLLFFAPDAVSLSGKVYSPRAIMYVEITEDEHETVNLTEDFHE